MVIGDQPRKQHRDVRALRVVFHERPDSFEKRCRAKAVQGVEHTFEDAAAPSANWREIRGEKCGARRRASVSKNRW